MLFVLRSDILGDLMKHRVLLMTLTLAVLCLSPIQRQRARDLPWSGPRRRRLSVDQRDQHHELAPPRVQTRRLALGSVSKWRSDIVTYVPESDPAAFRL